MKEMIFEDENVYGTLVLNIYEVFICYLFWYSLPFLALSAWWGFYISQGDSTSFVVLSNWAPVLYWLCYFCNFQMDY